MTLLMSWVAELLTEAGFTTAPSSGESLIFESQNVLGFVLEFSTPQDLIRDWSTKLDALISRHELALRRSGEKTWNAYAVILCSERVDSSEKAILQTIEEDLTGTRKIVRAALLTKHDVTQALLPLLPLQRSPDLPAIDMRDEIRTRTSELSEAVLQAFFSTATDAIALQVMEESE